MRRTLVLSALGFACALISLRADAAPTAGSLVINLPRNTLVASSDPQDAARNLLFARASIPTHVVLAPERTFFLRGTTVYRFAQVHMGVPVFARGGAVAVDDQGTVILATVRTERDLPASVVPAVTAESAASIASQFAEALATDRNATLVIVPMPGGSRLAWMVQAPPMLPELYAPLVTVDAMTGAVLASVNAVRFKNDAKVFKINPVEDNEVTTTVTLPVGGTLTTPANDDIVSWNCVDNGTVKIITTQNGSRKVHLCDLVQAPADPGTGDFTQYDRKADNVPGDMFAELQIFYHANQAYDYFRSFDNNASFKLGGSDYPLFAVSNWMSPPKGTKIDGGVEGGVEAGSEGGMEAGNEGGAESGTDAGPEAGDAGAEAGDGGLAPLRPFQNAAYVPYQAGGGMQSLTTLYPEQITGGVLQFGQGVAADYSYDGMVVSHEFTHAVVNSTLNLVPYWHLDTQGATVSPGALNEGLADFFSAAIYNKAKLGTYAIKDMQGPGIPVTDCIRNLDNANSCPKDMIGEVHTDSVFFTGALWKVRDQLATDADKKKFSQAMFTVMTTIMAGDIGFEDLASAFVTVLGNTMDTATTTAMQDEFTARGVLPQCDRILTYKGQPIRGTDPMQANTVNIGGVMEFNAQIPYAPTFFQVRVNIAEGTQELVSTFKALSSGYGGQSSFAPSFLVKYESPITFDLSSGLTANTDVMVDATTPSTGDAGTAGTTKLYAAHIPIPAGTKTAYVMLINSGNSGAYFIDLAFNATIEDAGSGQDASEDASIDSGEGGSAGADAATDAPGNSTPAEASVEGGGDCGCRMPRSSTPAGGVALLLAAAAWLARRKRASRSVDITLE